MRSVTPRLIDLANIREANAFDIPTWERVLSTGRLHGVSGRWHDALEDAGILGRIPAEVAKHLCSDRLIAENSARTMRWETDRIAHAFHDSTLRVLLLKGAAYVARGFRAGRGRISADVDILVPEADLPEAEAKLRQHGWYFPPESEYDERYYREWMHELPPLRHNPRGTALDVHHNLLPRTSRLYLNSAPLFDAAWRVDDTNIWTLGPQDMVIHSAIHGFYNGELTNCYRDVLDIHELVTDLGDQDSTFWTQLISRTELLGVGRAVFYALRYAHRFLHTAVPTEVLDATRRWGPAGFTITAMDRAIASVYLPSLPPTVWQHLALQALYLRSHWIKMPPRMLANHLWTKYKMRGAGANDEPKLIV